MVQSRGAAGKYVDGGERCCSINLLVLSQQIYEPYVLYGYFNLIEHHKTIEDERKHWLLNSLVELFCEAKPRG